MLFSFVCSFLSQAFEDRHFRKLEVFSRDSLRPAESKPNNKMIRKKTIGVRFMGGKLPERRWRAECRTGDLEQRTKRKCSSRRWLNLSSRYFLKRSKLEISENLRFSCALSLRA